MRIAEYLAKVDGLYEEQRLAAIPGRRELLSSIVGKGRSVLDIGCGTGLLACELLRANNEVWGVEINTGAVEQARARGLRVKQADVEEGLPFEDEYFDFVHVGAVLESLYDTRHFLEECRRVLKRDGHLVVSTWNLNSLRNRLRVLRGRYLTELGAYPEDHGGGHLRVFNLEKLKELCAEAGFEVQIAQGLPYLHGHDRWLDRPVQWAARIAPGLAPWLVVTASPRGV